MNVNLNTVLVGMEGKPIKRGKEYLTLKKIIVDALLQVAPDEQNLSAENKLKRYDLALLIKRSDEISLEAEDTSLIKMLINKVFSTLIVGQTHNILEGCKTGLEGYSEMLSPPEPPKPETQPPTFGKALSTSSVRPLKSDDESIPNPDVEVLEPRELEDGRKAPKFREVLLKEIVNKKDN